MAQDEQRGEAGKKPLWELDKQEQRLLWITFVGGLGSIVVGAVLIGGALALSRWFVRRNGLGILGEFTWWYSVTGVGFLMWRLGWLRTGEQSRFEQRMGRVSGVLWLVGAAYMLLVWVGLAAGVK